MLVRQRHIEFTRLGDIPEDLLGYDAAPATERVLGAGRPVFVDADVDYPCLLGQFA